MIYSYGVSMPGTYHIKNDIVCQDCHKIIHSGDNMAVAAVADGLGSAAHSDVGSSIAATVAVEYCCKRITRAAKANSILEVIKAAFTTAQRAIEKQAAELDKAVEQYDTTLTLAVLIRDTLYYGHSGDSGMIALTTSGRYEPVTVQQRDSEGRVFPLFFEDKWVFAQYSEKVSSVLLATDGMLEILFPIYIKNNPVKIHISLAQFFMDNSKLRIDKKGRKAVESHIAGFMESIPDEKVNDDKTIAVLVNTSVRTKEQPPEYYMEPNWETLKREYDDAWKREAYPGLYKNIDIATESEPIQPSQQSVTVNPAVRSQPISQPQRKMKISRTLLLMLASAVLLLVLFAILFLFYITCK